MKWTFSLLVMAGGVLVFWNFLPHTHDFQVYQYLMMPHISERPSETMIMVTLDGDPDVVGKHALSALFKAFYALKAKHKELVLEKPRVRWPQPPETPRAQWRGLYALPIPPSIKHLPDSERRVHPQPEMTVWEYGTVAEILHIGPPSESVASLEKLKNFITEQGYVIVGMHEEEYLKGPGFFGRGDSRKYRTLLRYRVEKALMTDPKSLTATAR